MPAIDLIDETFISAHPALVAAAVHEQHRWHRWWPALTLVVFMDRGPKGVRWTATGAVVGSLEIWLEPWGDGVLLHHYVRVDPTEPGAPTVARPVPSDPAGWRRAIRERDRYARRWKQHVWALKDELEAGRSAAEPATGRSPAPRAQEPDDGAGQGPGASGR